MPTAIAIWFISYVGYCLARLGITDSISDTWYKLQEKLGNQWLFEVFCGGLGLGLILLANQYNLHPDAELAITVSAFSAWAVAVCANFRYGQKERKLQGRKMTRVDILHYGFSGVLIGGCLIGLWIQMGFLHTAVFAIGVLAILLAKKKIRKVPAIWAIEVWAFIVVEHGFFKL